MPEHYDGTWMKEAAVCLKKKKKKKKDVFFSYILGNVSSHVKLPSFVTIHFEYFAVNFA